jgi:tRNA(Ile)-lysidine synthase
LNTGNRDALKTEVLNTIKENNLINKNDSVILGVSGGPDSVCLLHVLHSMADIFNMKIFAFHLNHMLRGEESDKDEQYVRKLCGLMGIPLTVESCDVKGFASQKGISIEEAGRELRYAKFKEAAVRKGASKIAVAHNRNDQAETIIMNILRGTGLDGLKGMEYRNGEIIRPLLSIDRKSIEEYCRANSLNYRIDSSNLKTDYTRNKVRIELIPYIDRIMGIDCSLNIFRMALLLKDDQDFIEKAAKSFYEQCKAKSAENEVSIDILVFEKYHPAMQKRVLRNAFFELTGSLKGIESIHVNDAVKLALEGRTGAIIHLPRNIRVSKSYGLLKISSGKKNERAAEFRKNIIIPGDTHIDIGGQNIILKAFKEKRMEDIEVPYNIRYNSLEQVFDYDKVKMGINIRNREQGDVFKPLKSNGTKKLKKYLIDKKIPVELRDKIPLIAQGNEIIWIIGYGISDKFKVTENTKTVLRLKYIKA